MSRRKRKNRSVDPAEPAFERPPAERAQHDAIELADRVVFHDDGTAERTFGARVITQRMIDRYRVGGQIDARQWAAGDRFQVECLVAQSQPRMVANLTGAGGGSTGDANDRKEAARRSRDAALAALPMRLRAFAVAVIRDDRPAATLCTDRGARAAMVAGLTLLRLSLDCLADHYKIEVKTAA